MKHKDLLSQLVVFLLGAIITAIVGFRFQFLRPIPDSDQFYHYAISKIMLERGIIRSLPEVAGLNWGKLFPDKEFFFHVFSSSTYWLAGENGIRWGVIFLAATLIGILTITCAKFCNRWIALFLTLTFLPLDSFFIHRLFLVRPHVMAMLWFCILLLGLIKHNRYIVLVSCTLFALSYHAIYIPLALVAIYLFSYLFLSLVPSRDTRAVQIRVSCFAVFGLILGSALHPIFPNQFTLMFDHLGFALSTPANLNIGAEVESLSIIQTWLRSPYLYTLTLFSCLHLSFQFRSLLTSQRFILLANIPFLLITFWNPRAVEYLAPLSTLLCSQWISRLNSPIKNIALVSLPLFFLLVPLTKLTWLFTLDSPVINQGRLAALRAAAAIERDESSETKSVFNCSYNSSPYLLYGVSKVRFIDILDPRLLLRENLELHNSRAELIATTPSNLIGEIQSSFESQYIICRGSRFTEVLDSTPGIKRLYPQDRQMRAAVQSYKIEE